MNCCVICKGRKHGNTKTGQLHLFPGFLLLIVLLQSRLIRPQGELLSGVLAALLSVS